MSFTTIAPTGISPCSIDLRARFIASSKKIHINHQKIFYTMKKYFSKN
ncbi:hypothetical protein HMPREF9129_0275 [Peptoniphilus indolicus ATCC 29427]|uniref:Uncharacterized protein n=1 Tax=Peptoniphilus indolicus ATCC 29427 TaxID=997350 RepID=G4D1J5_9FIRM|nr:hypothetical protein HMPREF9129_0275 [Peptoniphilus indolicus ATCC 29427]